VPADKPAWLNHNRQPQKTMKAGRCGMARSQVLRLSDTPEFYKPAVLPPIAHKWAAAQPESRQSLTAPDFGLRFMQKITARNQ